MTRRLAHRLKKRLTFANVVALLALFVALGGTSIGKPVRDAGASAAASLKSVLKLSHKADRNARLALSTARRADKRAKAALAKAAIPGPPGATGAPGLNGSSGQNGSAVAYAGIEYCPSSAAMCPDQPTAGWYTPDEEARSVDNGANFSNPSPGVFCFSNLIPELHIVTVSMGPSGNSYLLQGRTGTIDHPISASLCPNVAGGDDHNAVVEVRDPTTNALTDPNHADKFFAVFN